MSVQETIKRNGMAFGWELPGDLNPHPLNYRKHGAQQRKVFNDTLSAMGWLDALIVNRTTNNVLDGHLRQDESDDARPAEKVPVLWITIPEEEEAAAIGVVNKVREMATEDEAMEERLKETIDKHNAKMGEALFNLEPVVPTEFPSLPTGKKDTIQQRCFQLHDEQAKAVIDALAKAKSDGHGKSKLSDNSNGNALAYICRQYLNQTTNDQ